MNGWERDKFARETAAEMQRQNPQARWTNPSGGIWLVNVGGYVNITISSRGGHISFKLELDEAVARRQEPADNTLLDNARAAFYKAFDIVTRRETGLREET